MKVAMLMTLAVVAGAIMVVSSFLFGYLFGSLSLFWVLFLGGILISIGARTAIGLLGKDARYQSKRRLSFINLTISISSFVLALIAYFVQEQIWFEASLGVFLVSILFLQKLRANVNLPRSGI